MRFLPLCALVFGLGASGCNAAPTSDAAPATNAAPIADAAPATDAAEATARAEFAARMKDIDAKGDWQALLKSGQEWQISHPDDPTAHFATARAAYMLGEIEVSIAAWEKLVAMDPLSAPNGARWLKTARDVRRNFPALKLKPLEWKQGDAGAEAIQWTQKGAALLAAKSYDEIEQTAATLQKSKAANIKGSPHLSLFFDGLCAVQNKDYEAHQGQIAAWRAARPKSYLARLAEIQGWTDTAWHARGTGFASTITPEMSAKIDAALKKGTQALENLPETAFSASPLSFEVALDWGQLSGAPREFLDEMFTVGTTTFPDYLPLYRIRAYQLLPRWFGEPGEWEAMTQKRADQIGGQNGDVFYGRVVWSLLDLVPNLAQESNFDYERAQRGLEILHKRRPDSISVSSARLVLAYKSKDWKTAQQLLSVPHGHILDSSWPLWNRLAGQKNFAEQRMLILGESTE